MKKILLFFSFILLVSCKGEKPKVPSVYNQIHKEFLEQLILTTDNLNLKGKVKTLIEYDPLSESQIPEYTFGDQSYFIKNTDSTTFAEFPLLKKIKEHADQDILYFEFNEQGKITKEIKNLNIESVNVYVEGYSYFKNGSVKEMNTIMIPMALIESREFAYDENHRIIKSEQIHTIAPFHHFSTFQYLPDSIILEDYKIVEGDTQSMDKYVTNLEGVEFGAEESLRHYEQDESGNIIHSRNYDNHLSLIDSKFKTFLDNKLKQQVVIDSFGIQLVNYGAETNVRSISTSENGFEIVINNYDSQQNVIKQFRYKKWNDLNFSETILDFSYDFDKNGNWTTKYRGLEKKDDKVISKRIIQYF